MFPILQLKFLAVRHQQKTAIETHAEAVK